MRIDRLVLTAASIEAIRAFHERTPGMETVTFGEGRTAPCRGEHGIGLHEAEHGFEPESRSLTPGPGNGRRDPAGPVQYDPVPPRPAGRQWLEIPPRSGRARSAGGSLAVPT